MKKLFLGDKLYIFFASVRSIPNYCLFYQNKSIPPLLPKLAQKPLPTDSL